MTKQISLFLVILSLFIIQIVSLRVVYTCQVCKNSTCTNNSTSCYRLDGAGFNEFQICAQNPCTPGDQYEEFGSECSINSDQVLCRSRCCISPTRNSYQSRRCADSLDYGSRYCDGQLSIAAVGGIIFGSIVAFILIGVGTCLIINKCKKDKELELQQSSKIHKASYRLRKQKSENNKLNAKPIQGNQIGEIKIGGSKIIPKLKLGTQQQSEVKLSRNNDQYL